MIRVVLRLGGATARRAAAASSSSLRSSLASLSHRHLCAPPLGLTKTERWVYDQLLSHKGAQAMQIKSIIETNTRLEGELLKASKLMLQNISNAKEQARATASADVTVLGLGSLLGLFLLYRIFASSEKKAVAEAKAKAPAAVTEEAAAAAVKATAAAVKATAATAKATTATAKATVAAAAASAAAASVKAAAKVAPAGEKSE